MFRDLSIVEETICSNDRTCSETISFLGKSQTAVRREAKRVSSSICLFSGDRRHLYSILSGPTDVDELVDCQILLVNIRQRNYADQIESRLIAEGLRTSIRLLREDFTLIEAIQLASQERCLYAIIAMPMHEERRTGSFHILYGQTEGHFLLLLFSSFRLSLACRTSQFNSRRWISHSLDELFVLQRTSSSIRIESFARDDESRIFSAESFSQ